MSRRFTDLPISVHSFGSFSFTSFGGSSFAASFATFPKPTLRPLGRWVITLFAATHSSAGTPHFCAAAAISISRAVAPALRRYSCELRIVRLPTAAMSPHTRLRRTCSLAEAYSTRTFFQSHSSSSATSIGADVKLPWPISERAYRMTTLSSGWTSTQALTSVPAFGLPFWASADGKWKPTASPPPTRAELFRNSRREALMEVIAASSRLGRLRGGVDRRADPGVGAAATDVGHRRIDVAIGGLRVLPQQRNCGHDLARLTISALRDFMIDPSLLHRVHPPARREAFDRHHSLTRDSGDRERTGAHRLTVHVYRARAALRDAAAVLGSLQVQHVPKRPQQRHLGLDIDLPHDAVDAQRDHRSSLGEIRKRAARSGGISLGYTPDGG